MPRRTNTFQQVIYMIKAHLSSDASVRESVELADLITGTKREVDVVIESTVSGHKVLIGIECRDHARRQSVTWINEMDGKHSTLPTNLLILASSSGFTAEARKLAAARGIELIAANFDNERRALDIKERVSTLTLKEMRLNAEEVFARTESTDLTSRETVRTLPDNYLFRSTGYRLGSVAEIVNIIIGQAMEEGGFIAKASPETRKFWVECDPAAIHFNDNPTAEFMYMEKLEPSRHLKRVQGFSIRGTVEHCSSDVPLFHGEIPGVTFSYGHLTSGSDSLLLVRTKDSDGNEVFSTRSASGTVQRFSEIEIDVER